MKYPEYAGLSYEAASRKVEFLLALAVNTGMWFDLPERLTVLREIMQRAHSAAA